MALPAVLQEQDFGRRVVTTPALVNSKNWTPGDVWLDGHLAVHYNDGLRDVGAGVQVNVTYTGAFRFACGSAVTAAKDSDAYYDQINKTIVVAPGTNIIYVGKFVNAKTNGQTSALVELNSLEAAPDMTLLSARFRSTIAEVNAGKVLLPAIPGFRYRVSNIRMIGIGGFISVISSVDILATQSAASVKLFAGLQPNMTQSTVLTAGGTGTTVLADGASFAPNDVNTPITISKTGGTALTATHVDVLIDYVLEAA